MDKKQPAFQFYTGDWLKDPRLSLCLPATRGIWIDLMCRMHDDDRCGQISGTVDQLAQLARCSRDAMVSALAELDETGTADVAPCHGNVTACHEKVTVTNRRMRRDFQKRTADRLRQSRHRGNPVAKNPVTKKSRLPSSSSSSTSSSNRPASAGCPEPPAASEPTGFVFPIVGKGAKTWTLPKAKLAEYRESFPGVDVKAEIRKALQWCRDNPTKRKTATGMAGFLSRWLGKAQNSARGSPSRTNERDTVDINAAFEDQP